MKLFNINLGKSKLVRLLCVLLIYLTSTPSSFSQITFERCFNYGSAENGFSVAQTFDGGYIVSGRHGISLSVSHLLLIKTDSLGNEEWVKSITSGPYQHEGWCIKQLSDSGFIITGQADDIPNNAGDIYLVRTDKSGDTIWTRNYSHSETDIGLNLENTFDNGFVIAGYRDTVAHAIKTDNNGHTIWANDYLPAGAIESKFFSARQLTDSGFVMFGTASYSSSLQGFYLVRIDKNGDTVWTKTLPAYPYRIGKAIEVASDGGFIATGVKSVSIGENAAVVIKFNSNGDTLWTRTFGGINNNDDAGISVHEDFQGNYVIFGNTTTFSTNPHDFWLLKLDSQGNLKWNKTINSPGSQQGYNMQITNDGGFIMCGTASTCLNFSSGVYLAKADSSGSLLIGLSETSAESHYTFYPNPVNEFLRIKNHYTESTKVQIHDIFGNLIQEKYSTENEFSVDCLFMEEGIYILNLFEDRTLVYTKKLVVIH